jgi:hypothetical protein
MGNDCEEAESPDRVTHSSLSIVLEPNVELLLKSSRVTCKVLLNPEA